jgi:hypothetical protein
VYCNPVSIHSAEIFGFRTEVEKFGQFRDFWKRLLTQFYVAPNKWEGRVGLPQVQQLKIHIELNFLFALEKLPICELTENDVFEEIQKV